LPLLQIRARTGKSRINAAWPSIAAAAITIVLGLIVHRTSVLPPRPRDVLGDVLWAAMMMFLLGAALPRVRLLVRAGLALAICFAVEISQAYHSPRIDALRATAVGRLVLGSDFDARDLAAYALGVVSAALLLRFVLNDRGA
jgi:hypothetical protein